MKRRLFFKKFRGEEKKQKQLVERWLYLPFSHLLPRLVNKMQTRGNTKRDRILSSFIAVIQRRYAFRAVEGVRPRQAYKRFPVASFRPGIGIPRV